jgi:type I restriction enzyme, S subunit
MYDAAAYPTVRLEQLVDVLDDLRAPVNGEERSRRIGTVPYYGANGQQGWIDRPLTNEPLILLAEDGGNFDAFAERPIAYRIDGPAWVNNHAHIIRAKPGVSQSFVYWSIAHKDIRQFIAGGTRTKLTQGELRRIEVRAPDEPQRAQIAEILDTLDTTIRQTEAIIEKLKQVKQGLLHDLLTRGIAANGELRPPQSQAPHLYKASPLGWIPRDWAPNSLGQVLVGGTRNGLYKPNSFHGSGPLMVQMGGMFRGAAVDFQSATRVRVTRSELSTFGLEVGDLLFARRSLTFEGAGQCAIVRNLPEASTFESSIVRVRVDRSRVEPEFAALFLRGALSSEHRRTLIRQVAVSGVSSDDIVHFLIALPRPAEQAAIINAIASVQNRIEREIVESRKLSLLKSGLMDDLLTGRVRVTPLLRHVDS